MELATKTNIHFTDFYSLFSWDVKAYLSNSSGFNPSFPLVLFGEFLSKANVDKIKIEDNEEYKILGVRSYGKGVFENRFVKGSTLKMKEYYRAKANHLFWCKVDTKNGAFGVIKNDLADGLGSTNMTFAEINTNKINVDFLQLLFTSKGVMQYLDSYVTGTTNRKYIRPDQLLNEIKIPLPTLAEQQQIVDAYTTKIQQAQALQAQANNLEDEIEKYVNNELGFRNEKISLRTKGLSFINFENLNRWDINFLYQTENENKSKYPLISYNDLFISLNNGIPARNYSLNGTRFLKVADIKNNQIDSANIKFIEKFKENELIDANTLLITRKGTVGNSYFVTEDGKFTASSEIFIIKLNNKVDGNYIAEINLTEFIKKQYREKNTGTIMPSLSQEKLREILIPLPPIEKQREIVDVIRSLKTKLNKIKIEIEQSFEKAQQEFEQSIFN